MTTWANIKRRNRRTKKKNRIILPKRKRTLPATNQNRA